MLKSLSGGAGSEAAMIMFRGIFESSFYDAHEQGISVILAERKVEMYISHVDRRST
jgi:hypothetical protein